MSKSPPQHPQNERMPAGRSNIPAENQPELLIRVVDGPHRGTRAPVREGFAIGRKAGDLILKDSKLSVKHAHIEWRDSDWFLVDLGSSNKIKVDGSRCQEVVLHPGLRFILGSTTFEVLEKPHQLGQAKARDFEMAGSGDEPIEALTWREILSALITRVQALPGRPIRAQIRPFPTVLRLEFTSGVQAGTVWQLGYGPREAGARSFDLPLFDEAVPDSAFFLDTVAGKISFRPAQGAGVQINGQPASREWVPLQSGDRIEIGTTRIRALLDSK